MHMNRLLLAFLLLIILAPGVLGCKVIVAMDEVTAGDYNLLLKVRDPSRPGLQVLGKVEVGYRYEYHTPWTGQPIEFTVEHAFLGVATRGDTPPNVFKPGMSLSDAGIAYGDADLPSYWINPSPYAWDDFDWIRYACQNASTEQEGVDLLVDVVEMHAPRIPENLFLVGPNEGYVVEATAYHYDITNIDGIETLCLKHGFNIVVYFRKPVHLLEFLRLFARTVADCDKLRLTLPHEFHPRLNLKPLPETRAYYGQS